MSDIRNWLRKIFLGEQDIEVTVPIPTEETPAPVSETPTKPAKKKRPAKKKKPTKKTTQPKPEPIQPKKKAAVVVNIVDKDEEND